MSSPTAEKPCEHDISRAGRSQIGHINGEFFNRIGHLRSSASVTQKSALRTLRG